MKLLIRTLESTVFSGEVTSVTLPGEIGSFQVLKNHAPLVSSLTKGTILFVANGSVREIAIEGGFVEVKDNTISLYTDIVEKE
ncbi:MAG TPA: F0F1 ATP synthase subunit epsilon [Bacteroidales bacterium]|nr:F0F1 ATP synthase subunit epsilon [Bacteroidales bacterium]HPK30670.1 F0F1 ATP synthase subunit epsilon [Bacteroidales bacterium]